MEDHIWELVNNWNAFEKYLGTKATGSRQLCGVGVEWKTTGKESGGHVWNKTEIIGRPHLQDKRETTRRQVGNNILKDDWETTGRQMEDAWRQLADQFWETNGNCGRQLEDIWGNHPLQNK